MSWSTEAIAVEFVNSAQPVALFVRVFMCRRLKTSLILSAKSATSECENATAQALALRTCATAFRVNEERIIVKSRFVH